MSLYLIAQFSSMQNMAMIAVAVIAFVLAGFMVKNSFSKSSSSCYEDAYKLLPDGVVVLNEAKQFSYINLAAEKMLNCKLRSVMGKNYRDVFEFRHLKTRRVLQGLFSEESSGDETISAECLLQTQENHSFAISLNIMPLVTRRGGKAQSNTVMLLSNITERKAIESKLSDIEKHDSLTRMLNRKSFDTEIKLLIENSYKHEAMHVLAYFTIDQFQVVNDAVGYVGGDSLIVQTGELIKKHLNKGLDVIGRVGGAEFAVIFRERKLVQAVREINAILLAAQNTPFNYRGANRKVTMSAGFVLIDVKSTSSTRALFEANVACNTAKKRGGNILSVYKPEDSEIKGLDDGMDWMVVLRDAMQLNQFQIYAQPIHSLKPSEYIKPFSHYELLLRLFDGLGNPIYPDEFIAAAEYYSMMPDLDRWVVKNTLLQLSGVPRQNPTPIFAINLSGQSLNDPRFLDYVVKEVRSSGVDPKMLCFEITEQVAVEDLSLMNNFISKLKALGASFSLDDFGTGMSSYGYLRSLDVDYVKIDGSFVKNIVDDDVSRAMVQSINQVGHTMGLKVIAEYVENEAIQKMLSEMGVDYGQGYHILRPTPLDEMLVRHKTVNKRATA